MKTNRLIFALLFIFLLIILSSFAINNDKTKLDRVTASVDIAAKIAAMGGLLGILYQFMRERDLSEAQFVVNLNQDFINSSTISRIYQLLEASKVDKQKQNPFTDKDIIDMANYLSFFEPFYGLIQRHIVQLKTIDPILAYRFFLATNNKFFQEMLLCKSGKEVAWRDIYLLHQIWKKYRKERELDVWQEEYDLFKRDESQKIISKFS